MVTFNKQLFRNKLSNEKVNKLLTLKHILVIDLTMNLFN